MSIRTKYTVGDHYVFMTFDLGVGNGPQEWLVRSLGHYLYACDSDGTRPMQLCSGLSFDGSTLMCPQYATGEQIVEILRREMSALRRSLRKGLGCSTPTTSR